MSSGINRIEVRRESHGIRVYRRWPPPALARALGMDPPTEVAAQRLAAQQGLAPEVLAFDAEAREMSMPFIEGRSLEHDWIRRPARLELMQRVIKVLRGIPPLGLPALDLPGRLVELHTALLRVDAGRARSWTARVEQCVQYWQTPSSPPAELARSLVHGDLGAPNILLRPDGSACLVDWEYAHGGHPDEDLAGLAALLEPGDEDAMQLRGWSLQPENFSQRVELRRLLDGVWLELARVIGPRDSATSA